MKKILISLFLCVQSFSVPAHSLLPVVEQIVLNVQTDHGENSSVNFPKTPIVPPNVGINDHVLFLLDNHGTFTLELRDSSGTVVYTTYVDATDTQVVLPSAYTGTYELRLCTESYYFYGEITL